MSLVGDISAVATLILFVFYFIGRTWAINQDSKYPKLKMVVDVIHSIEDYDTFDINLEGDEVVVAKYDQNIKWFQISEVEWNKDMTGYDIGECLGRIEKIPANTEITICTIVPEGYPTRVIQFELANGLQGELLIGYDGRRNGNGISTSGIKLKKTVRAWIYYWVR